jgi:hypothetical protein
MAEYYAHAHSEPAQAQAILIPRKKNFGGFGFDQLAAHYGVEDMMDFSGGDASSRIPTEQTVDDEFYAYTTANFEHAELRDAEIIAFWEVGILGILASCTRQLMCCPMATGKRN